MKNHIEYKPRFGSIKTNITYFVSFETKIIYQNNYCTSKSAKCKNKIYISKIKYTFLKKLFKILMSKNYQNR